ncbi:MAG: hypothetical protein NTU74_13125 [Deltaproteobacteria bacterium]|nr:hypothetical protein [Deltaproteobacteria bacterium]
MNCIDAIEGSFKCLINRFHQVYLDESLDDTIYVRNIRSLIEGLDDFIQHNKELQLIDPKILKSVIYGYAKDKWLKSIRDLISKEHPPAGISIGTESDEYYLYYFDYIYHHGMYPR